MFTFRPVARTVVGSFNSLPHIFGGNNGSAAQSSIQTYDGTTRSSLGVTLAVGNFYSSATNIGSDAFIFGGYDGSAALSTIQRLSGGIRSTDGTTLGAAYQGTCAATLSSLAYIFYTGSSVCSLQEYTGSARSQVATLSGRKDFASAATLGSAIYSFGGDTSSAIGSNTIRKWDGTTFSNESATLSNSFYRTSAALAGSSLRIFGGTSGTLGNNVNTIQSYDGTTRSTDGSTLATINGASAATSIGSNAYIFGGASVYDVTSPVNTIQKYTGSTRTTESATLASNLFGASVATTQSPVFTMT